ncbi:hypothetical protein DFH06DRAFT_1292574 [Mycena polygramma]|nr:hypothetical protein DFH06DRAFT_1292574 [Mycena polygramma]
MLSVAKVFIALTLACTALGMPQDTEVMGTVFRYDPGQDIGACGWKNTSSQMVCTVSNVTFWGYPGVSSKNPNKNPICHHSLNITASGKSVLCGIVDYFEVDKHAGPHDVGVTDSEFEGLGADLDDGIIEGADWYIV